MISIRFNTKLLEHVKTLKEVKKSGFTAYVENLCIKASKFKDQ